MQKKIISMALSEKSIEKLNGIMEGITDNRSSMVELLIHMVDTYFDKDQIEIEYDMYSFSDGRVSKL